MDQKSWNAFVKKNGPRSGAFLQSWGWLQMQERMGKEVKRMEGEKWIAGVIKNIIGQFYYWYCPRGPVLEDPRSKIQDPIIKTALQGAIAFRFDLPIEISNIPISQYPNIRPAPHDIQPRTTMLINLSISEDDLLKSMHHKTRYNIRVSERAGVRVERCGLEAFDIFWQLLSATTERGKFRLHGRAYYENLLKPTDDPDLSIFLAIAYVDDTPAAAAIMCDFGGARTYLHGASHYPLRDKMAPFALHWFLMREAKQRSLSSYDFWGIAPTDDPAEPLFGVTRFKKGWGGEVVRYPQTMDMVLRPFWYRLYRLAHRFLI